VDVVYTHCAGLDVHKKTVAACRVYPGSDGRKVKEIRTFSTMTQDLLTLGDWLRAVGVTQVAIESTGEFWKPVFNILESSLEVILVNAQHVKAVPGRKTDVQDAEWLADLLQHGLLRASFIPPKDQRDLRDLTRQRANLVQERAMVVQWLQKVLEGANIKLSAVASDIMGVSGRAMLEGIVAGKADAAEMAELSKGRMRDKRALLEQALTGSVRAHHRFLLAQHLMHIDFLDERIAAMSEEIISHLDKQQSDHEEAIALLDTIPGIGRGLAEVIIAEIGTDMSHFPSAGHLASWAGLAPGNNESAGKRRSGKTKKGDKWLRSGLIQAAHAATRKVKCYFAAQYHRLAARRGKKKAAVAVAHSILVTAYYVLLRREPYRELGANYFDEHKRESTINRLTRRLENLGYRVSLELASLPAPA
jgi:transposase